MQTLKFFKMKIPQALLMGGFSMQVFASPYYAPRLMTKVQLHAQVMSDHDRANQKGKFARLLRKGKRDIVVISGLGIMIQKMFIAAPPALAIEVSGAHGVATASMELVQENGNWAYESQTTISEKAYRAPSVSEGRNEALSVQADLNPVSVEEDIQADDVLLVQGNPAGQFGQRVVVERAGKPTQTFELNDAGELLQQNDDGTMEQIETHYKFKKIINLSGTMMTLTDDGYLKMYDPYSHFFKRVKSGVNDISLHRNWFVVLEEGGSVSGLKVSKGEAFKIRRSHRNRRTYYRLFSNLKGNTTLHTIALKHPLAALETHFDDGHYQTVVIGERSHSHSFESIIPIEGIVSFSESHKVQFGHGDDLKVTGLRLFSPGDQDDDPNLDVVIRFERTWKHVVGGSPVYEIFHYQLSDAVISDLKRNPERPSQATLKAILHSLVGSGSGEWQIIQIDHL